MVGFVLAGGASLGAIEVGMLRALYEREITPDLIVGTSAGSVNAAFIASRPQTPETAGELANVWRSTKTLEVFPPNPVTIVLGLLGERDHLIPNTGVKALLSLYQQFDRLEESPIPLHLITTDILSGEERRLSEGSLRDAVLASTAIPGVFPSIEFEGLHLVDGGVTNNTAISDAAELGATTIYVLPTGMACALKTPPRGAIPMLVHAITLLINQRLARDIEQFSHHAKLIVLPPPCPQTVLPSDFSQAEKLIEEGYALASEALDKPDPAAFANPLALHRLRPHHHP